MLPTNKKATIGSIVTTPNYTKMAVVNVLTVNDPQPCIHQHLYVISDERINQLDYGIDLVKMKVLISDHDIDYQQNHFKKIIATTDKSLFIGVPQFIKGYLPQPSDGFIQKYVDSFNNGNVIDWINVEYDGDYDPHYGGYYSDTIKLKVNPKDNTITIKPIKTSMSRDEVIIFIGKMISNGIVKPNLEAENFDTWIEKNL